MQLPVVPWLSLSAMRPSLLWMRSSVPCFREALQEWRFRRAWQQPHAAVDAAEVIGAQHRLLVFRQQATAHLRTFLAATEPAYAHVADTDEEQPTGHRVGHGRACPRPAHLLHLRRLRRNGRRTPFFLHVVPMREADLPPERIEHGYDNRDFHHVGVTLGERCVVRWQLPDYPIRHVRTGQYVQVRNGEELLLRNLWEGEADIDG